MRIQHNIMAMSAYRNYTNNVSAMKANLEKLSSGYKINRAGDDAAGLAISEKMRAQITGLETAQKNAKDGISLVQTAEGALTEVHDMLNRMVELATQSANGTYDDTTDRAQLQKEMDQLRSEIDRIADSSNFNGIKLLDGSLDSAETVIPGQAKVTLGAENMLGGTTLSINNSVSTDINGATGGSTVLHRDPAGTGKSSFEISLDGLGFSGVSGTVGTTFTLTIGTAAISTGQWTGKTSGTAEEIAEKFANANTQVAIGGVTYSISRDGSTLKFEMTDEAATASTVAASFTANFTVSLTATSGSIDNNSNVNLGTQNPVEGSPNSGKILANTEMNALDISKIKDGSVLQVGDESYILVFSDDKFASASSVANTDQGDGQTYKVVDLRRYTDPTQTTPTLKTDNITLSNICTEIAQVAKDNEMFSVGANADGTSIKLTFQEKSTYNGDADLKTLAGIDKEINFYDAAIMTVTTDTTVRKGKELTLQIGDTADPYNQLKVNVKDMHAVSLGLGSISIATQDGAAKAVDVIKSAINQVSDVRGTLGATQNRLDHTINNLSVMTENIQDAESTIRDTDVAEEMMAYTKNNILIQSAQAMLAQANQVPQGVLQLLQ